MSCLLKKFTSIKFILLLMCGAFCIQPGYAYASKIDTVFSGIIENSFRKAGKNVDDLAALRRGDSFSALLQKNDNFINVSRKVFDDDVLALKKIAFPAGSRYIDDLMALSKKQRTLAYALDDVVSRIAKLPAGEDIINTVGKKGLLLGSAYGDEFLETTYALARQNEVWDAAKLSVKALDADNVLTLRLLEKNNLAGKYGIIRRVSEFDPVDMMARVAKKYGPQGKESILEFFRKAGRYAWEFAKDNPKKTALGAVVALVYIEPDIILDPLGRLKDNAVEGLLNGLVTLTAEGSAEVASMPFRFGDKFIERIAPDLPVFLKVIASYIIAFIVLMLLLYIIPFTRFIPRYICNRLSNSRLIRRGGDNNK